MEKLKEVLYGEIEEFREKGHQFVNGEINMMQFKHASGGFGIYAHKGGKEFMIRLRIPSGITNIKEMKKVYSFVEKYGLGKIHLTTRQAIQLHGLSIDEVCDLMKEALDNDIYTRGAGGNYPRNVAISPLSGVDKNEAFDVTPYSLAVGNYFLKRIYTYHLPRKIKVSFSNGKSDTAHCTMQDLGFVAVKKDDKEYFQMYLGGGLGQNSRLSVKYKELINPKEVIYYVEAMVRMFKAEGDYENRNKARIRYIVERMGEEEFLKCYDKHLKEVKDTENLDINIDNKVVNKKGIKIDLNNERLTHQKQDGLYTVYIHPIGGQLKKSDLKDILDLIENFEDVEIRLAMTEGMYIRNLNGEEAKKLLEITEDFSAKTDFEQSVSCIGVPICQIGLCNSQGLLSDIISYFKEHNFDLDILPKIHVSGCGNSCGVHQISKIGFTGKKKRVSDKVEECFTLYIDGGYGVGTSKLGVAYGDMVAKSIPEFLSKLAKDIKENNLKFDEYIKVKEDNFKTIINEYLV